MASRYRWRQQLLGSLQGQLQLATYLVVFLGFTRDSSVLISGRDGNDRLRGSPPQRRRGDDVLLGGNGNDELDGGSGENHYLPGDGNNTITGGDGLDVVFFDGDKADYTGQAACTQGTCSLTTTIINREVLVFRDGRFDLR